MNAKPILQGTIANWLFLVQVWTFVKMENSVYQVKFRQEVEEKEVEKCEKIYSVSKSI